MLAEREGGASELYLSEAWVLCWGEGEGVGPDGPSEVCVGHCASLLMVGTSCHVIKVSVSKVAGFLFLNHRRALHVVVLAL